MSRQNLKAGDPKKVSSELLSLTYGSLVAQLVKDYENVDEVRVLLTWKFGSPPQEVVNGL